VSPIRLIPQLPTRQGVSIHGTTLDLYPVTREREATLSGSFKPIPTITDDLFISVFQCDCNQDACVKIEHR
jgi:hypothetical protein